MFELSTSNVFDEWLDSLGKLEATLIAARLDKVRRGLFGDVKPIGGGISDASRTLWPWIPHLFQKSRQQSSVFAGRRHQIDTNKRHCNRQTHCKVFAVEARIIDAYIDA